MASEGEQKWEWPPTGVPPIGRTVARERPSGRRGPFLFRLEIWGMVMRTVEIDMGLGAWMDCVQPSAFLCVAHSVP